MHTMKISCRLLLAGCALLASVCAPSSFADETAEKPVGKTILVLTGKISHKNAGEGFAYDMAMLEKLPQHNIDTKTPWHLQTTRFTGPLLRDVLRSAGASGKMLNAAALNDYKTAIPFDDAEKFDMIIAHRMDGKPMPVRNKGPLFIIYPFDDKSELRSQQYYSRSAWQLKSIDIQ